MNKKNPDRRSGHHRQHLWLGTVLAVIVLFVALGWSVLRRVWRRKSQTMNLT